MEVYVNDGEGPVATKQLRVRFAAQTDIEGEQLRVLFMALPAGLEANFSQHRYPNCFVTELRLWLVKGQ